MTNRWIALIPAYQPTAALIDMLGELKFNHFEIVVVDDGSGTAYHSIFWLADKYAAVLRHEKNQGKGTAIKTGLEYIRTHYSAEDITVTMDADGQHTVADAMRLCRESEAYPKSLVLGCRKLQTEVPLRSRFGNSITRKVYRITTGLAVSDTQTGLRAFSGEMIPQLLAISGERYEYEMNVLLDFARNSVPIQEVEIQTIYLDGNTSSHFDTVKDSYRIYKEILKFSASSLIGFCVDYILYTILSLATSGMVMSVSLAVSNVGARVVSASVNYTINRRLVFDSKERVAKSAMQYFLLAAVILAVNTLLLGFLTTGLGVNRYLAKICTEIALFFVNWLVQRLVIFRQREEPEV